MAAFAGGFSTIFILSLVVVLWAQVGNALVGTSCHTVSSVESLEVGLSSRGLVQLHVRNNIQGDVEILDASQGSDSLKIEIEKFAPNADVLTGIVTSHAAYDVIKGDAYVLQVDYVAKEGSLIPIITGSVVTSFALLILAITFIVCGLRRKRELLKQPSEVQEAQTDGSLGDFHSVPQIKKADVAAESSDHDSVLGAGSLDSFHEEDLKQVTSTPLRRQGSAHALSPSHLTLTCVTLTLVTCVSVVCAVTCRDQPAVKILVYIPVFVKLDSIQLFFNVHRGGLVLTDRWSWRNSTDLDVYDLPSVPLTSEPPCSSESQCPSAYNQNLAGCDAHTGQCVCKRGYQFKQGICIDLDECRSGLHACPSTAACSNMIGSYTCHCGYGYYGNKGKCHMCSVGCPSGLYESKPCSDTKDRVCSVCGACEGSRYEARPCRGNIDQECIHVAHPLLITGQETLPTFLEGMKVETSSNIFTENLHATRNLETTYYVTDNTQATDFFWVRESSLQVHIGIHDVHLIPEYEDVEHESDNRYMLHSPQQTSQSTEDIQQFRKVLRNYCRHPIPEYYSITVEIARDRITTAQQYKCDSRNPNTPDCPPDYTNGEFYLNRSINKPCEQMGTFPEPMVSALNSVVCKRDTALLRQLFNQSLTSERPIQFPSRQCRTAQTNCNQCLNQLQCTRMQLFERGCCQVECFTQKDCKMAYSEQCKQAPVECAMGDSYRYTIQPNFLHHFNEFQCHIRHRPPKVLYTLFYHIKVPGPYGTDSEMETPRVYKTIQSNDFDNPGQGEYQIISGGQYNTRDIQYIVVDTFLEISGSKTICPNGFGNHDQGEYKADYISVEHSSGLRLNEEFILVGRQQGKRMNYTVSSLKTPEEYDPYDSDAHDIASNVYVARTQFSSPFKFSTSSWDQESDCDKDTRKFKRQQKHYRNDGQNVSAVIQATDSPFQYFLKSVDNPPFIRFMVPGNTSVLPWYFREKGPDLLTDSSLSVDLTLDSINGLWVIHVIGKMSNCPGYLGVIIQDLLDEEELFNYDNLIFCYPKRHSMPTFFNLTFSFPNKGQRWDRTFDVRLDDSKKTYHVYLTHLLFETMFLQSEKHTEEVVHQPTPAPWPILAIILTATLILMLFLHVAYVYLEVTKVNAAFNSKKKNYIYYGTVGSAAVPNERCHQACDGIVMHSKSPKLTQHQSIFIICFVTFRIVYSLVFTFTVFLALMGLVLQGDLKTLSKLPSFQKEKYNSSSNLFTEIEKYEQQELLRQAQLVGNMQGACTNYLGEIFDAMVVQINNITISMNQVHLFSPSNSVTTLLKQWYYHKLVAYRDEINLFTAYYQGNVTKSLTSPLKVYRKYLSKVYKNKWLQFPQILFNKSNFHLDRPSSFHDLELSGKVVDFGVFLPLEEVEEVQLWALNLWEKFRLSQPDFPHLPPIEFTGKNLQCASEEFTLGVFNATERLLPQRSDSSRYVAPNLPQWMNKGQAWKPQQQKDKYKFFSKPEPPPVKFDIFDFQVLKQHLSLQFVWFTFVILDVFLLAYRCSHTFMTARTLYQGFENTVEISRSTLYDKPDVKAVRQCDTQLHESDASCLEYVIKAEGQKHVIPPIPPPVGNHISCNKMDSGGVSELHRNKYKSQKKVQFKKEKQPIAVCSRDLVLNMMASPFLPRLVVGMVICIIIVWGSSIAAAIFSADMITNLDGFRTFLVSLDVLVNRTNWYLTEQTNYYNNITMDIYKNQMTSELLNFQSVLQYFNSEQVRIVNNYVKEACAIRSGILGNRTCATGISALDLEVPMVPCNFIPIQSQLYRDFEEHLSESKLLQDFKPYLNSAHAVFLKSSYIIIFVLAAMLLCHVTGRVIFHFLKTRHKFPVHNICVTSHYDVAVEAMTCPVGICNTETDDDDENDEELKNIKLHNYRKYPVNSMESPERRKGLLSNFRYSETKV